MTELCFALMIAGSIPPGNLLLEIRFENIEVKVYSQKDKKKVVDLLCWELKIGE